MLISPTPDLDIGDQNVNASFMSLRTKAEESEAEKEPCYMKDENLIEDEDVASSLDNTEPDDFGDASGLDNLPLLVDHHYPSMYGVSGEDEVDKDSGYSQSRSSPAEDPGYTDMEAVDWPSFVDWPNLLEIRIKLSFFYWMISVLSFVCYCLVKDFLNVNNFDYWKLQMKFD